MFGGRVSQGRSPIAFVISSPPEKGVCDGHVCGVDMSSTPRVRSFLAETAGELLAQNGVLDALTISVADADRESARRAATLRARHPGLRIPDALVIATRGSNETPTTCSRQTAMEVTPTTRPARPFHCGRIAVGLRERVWLRTGARGGIR
jgi:hypothetical protein